MRRSALYVTVLVASLIAATSISAESQSTGTGSSKPANVHLTQKYLESRLADNEWAYFRAVDEEVLDFGIIEVPSPVIRQEQVPGENPGTSLDFIIVKYGDDISQDLVPQFKPGTKSFFANVPEVGYLAVKQVDKGERWVFKIGDTYIEKNFPVVDLWYEISWSYVSSSNKELSSGATEVTNATWAKRECFSDEGTCESRFMYGGNAVAYAELEDKWAQIDWFKVPLPPELGQFYIWPAVPDATCTVVINGRTVSATVTDSST